MRLLLVLCLVMFATAQLDGGFTCPVGQTCTPLNLTCPEGVDCEVYLVNNVTLDIAGGACPIDSYFNDSDWRACIPCPSQMLCTNDGVMVPRLERQYRSLNASDQMCDASQRVGTCINSVRGLSGTCDLCLPGYFSLPGYFRNATLASNNGSCQACAAGMYKSGYGAATTCGTCIAGSYSVVASAGCYACANGTYSSGRGRSSCSACDIRQVTTPRRDACVCSAGSVCTTSVSGGFTCAPCAPAHVWQNGGCVPCGAGSILSTTLTDTCVGCPPGTYAATPASMECLACDVGTYASGIGASTCAGCGWPAFIPNSRMTGCRSTVGLCNATTFYNNYTQRCEACLACAVLPDSYQLVACTGTANTICEACTQCGRDGGVAMPRDCGLTWDRVCVTCAPGTYLQASPAPPVACSQCALGTYASMSGSTHCGPCGGEAVVALNRSACVAYGSCGAGAYVELYYSNGNHSQACTLCPASTYGPGDGGCYACPQRWDAVLTGFAACNGCVASLTNGLCAGESWSLDYT